MNYLSENMNSPHVLLGWNDSLKEIFPENHPPLELTPADREIVFQTNDSFKEYDSELKEHSAKFYVNQYMLPKEHYAELQLKIQNQEPISDIFHFVQTHSPTEGTQIGLNINTANYFVPIGFPISSNYVIVWLLPPYVNENLNNMQMITEPDSTNSGTIIVRPPE